MAGRRLLVTQKQVKTILKGAAEAGVHLEIVVKDGVVRFVPCDASKASVAVDSAGPLATIVSMTDPRTPDAWFVVFTNPNQEERAERAIEEAGFTAYRPAWRKDLRHNRTKQIVTKVFRLFPRYVFVRLPAHGAPFGRVRVCDGVQSFLGVQGRPVAVPSRLVEWLEVAEVTGAYDEREAEAKAVPAFAVGDAVTVDVRHRWFAGEAAKVVVVHGRREVTLMLEHLAGMRPVRVSAGAIELRG